MEISNQQINTAGNPASQLRLLGLLGLIPFAALGLAALFVEPALVGRVGFALAAYGAVILSFIGGIHWGLIVVGQGGEKEASRMLTIGIGIVPSLLAWLTLLVSVPLALVMLVMGFAAMLGADFAAHRDRRSPGWFFGSRVLLTLAVVACLVTGLVATSLA